MIWDIILQKGESNTVEFKETADKSIADEVCAFANSLGGRIYIGVTDKGRVVGTDTSNTARSRLQDTINKIEPGLPFDITIMVEIFDDRVEITNPGSVPKGITKENFGSTSIARNPVIASLLHRADYIERMGTGINRIIAAMEEAGLEKPIFQTEGYFFKVVFKRQQEIKLAIGYR